MEVKAGIKRTAAMVILRSGDRFLLLERAKPPNIGHFVPVGGKLDPFEDPYTAALREVKEETGISLNEVKYLGGLIETSPSDYNWNSMIFIDDIPYMDPPFCDEGRLHWICVKDIEKYKTPPTDLEIYKYAIEGKPFMFNAIYNEHLQMIRFREEIGNIEIPVKK